MKIKKSAWLPMLGLGMGCLALQAQNNTASTIIAPQTAELLRTARFGEQVTLDNSMLLIADKQYRSDKGSSCNIGYGALFIYKRNTSGVWTRSQKLKHVGGINSSGVEAAENMSVTGQLSTSLTWNNSENGFGESGFDAAGNILVVAAPREDYNRLGPNKSVLAGAIYLYKRTSPTANFSLLTRIYDSNPSLQTRFADGGVATDGQFIATATQNNNTVSLFKLTENNVNLKKKYTLPSTWLYPRIHGTTDNNNIVFTAEVNGTNTLFLYRIVNEELVSQDLSSLTNISGYEIETGQVYVSGNYFVLKYRNIVTGAYKLKVMHILTNTLINGMDVLVPSDLADLTIAGVSSWADPTNVDGDSRTLAASFKSPVGSPAPVTPVIGYFKFKSNLGVYEYHTRMSLPSQYTSNASNDYADWLLLTPTELLISDEGNKSFDSTNDGIHQQCSEFKASGVVFVHARSNFEAAGPAGFRVEESVEQDALAGKLHPNPAQEGFVTFVSEEKPLEVYATKLGGNSLKLGVANDRIDVSALESGLYILRIRLSSGVITQKLTIK